MLSQGLIAFVVLLGGPGVQDAPPPPPAPGATPSQAPPGEGEPAPEVDPAEAERKQREELEGMLAGGDARGIIRWFARHRDEALPFIDSYLEGGLAMIEKGEGEEQARASFAKGVEFAKLATRAYREPAFESYAASFAGWTPDQRASFREGQKLFGEGRKALKEGDASRALELHLASLEKSRPLGDLWGMAMAQGGIASAKAALGEHEAALPYFDQAVELNEKLGLRMSELMARVGQSKSYRAMSRSRAAVGTMHEGESKLKETDPRPLQVAVLSELAEAYEAMGQPEQAERYRNRIPEEEAPAEAPAGEGEGGAGGDGGDGDGNDGGGPGGTGGPE